MGLGVGLTVGAPWRAGGTLSRVVKVCLGSLVGPWAERVGAGSPFLGAHHYLVGSGVGAGGGRGCVGLPIACVRPTEA